MADLLGLAFRDERVDCVVLRRRAGGTRVLAAFSLDGDDAAGATLGARLREAGARVRHAHVGLPRRLAVVKVVELPAVAGADVRRMVGFELERHLPFPPADALFDFEVLERLPGQPVRILLVAAERRTLERVRLLLRDAGCAARLVDVASHTLALAAVPGRAGSGVVRALLHVGSREAELVVTRGGRPVASRYVPLPEDAAARAGVLVAETRRTLDGLRLEERAALADLTVTGESAAGLAGLTEPSVRAGEVRLPGGEPVEPALLPAYAMAARRPLRGPLRTNLVPDEARPRPFPWPLATTAALAVATLLLGLAIPAVTAWRDQQRLERLDREVARLAGDVRRVEALAGAVERARREAVVLRVFQEQGVRALPVLRELTELLPADVWLTSLSADRKGVELAGFAASAAPLIPLLEGSPALERVEFTSPVTKGRDREQFRLRATWERQGPAPSRSPAPGATGRPPS